MKLHSSLLIILLAISSSAMAQLNKKVQSDKPVSVAAIPIVGYTRTQGGYLGAMTAAFYKANKKDTISPSSFSGIFGMYTAEKSYAYAVIQQLYLSQDRWRITAAVARADINFQFFLGDASANIGEFVDYSTNAKLAMGQVQRKIINHLYGGLYTEYNQSTTEFDLGDSIDVRNINNIGYIFSQDSRNNVYYPATGLFLNFKNQFYRDWYGSDNNFTRYVLTYNQFFDLQKNEKKILVLRVNLNIATGDVPFQGEAIVGMDDLRGYSQGKYRGSQVYTVQTEYRWSFNNSKFGIVGFFGVASAVEDFEEIFSTVLLPGIGAGIRYRIIPKEKINIGIDVGFGKDDYSLTFRIGESFSR
jgi:hypothetical protein